MNTVLIVEDEKMIRQGIKAIIQRSGVPVQNIMECSNGQSALAILESHLVDVMFTDIRMPKMNGIELVEAMQELEHKPLTVAISGYDDFSYAVQLLRMGIREYILKPVEREQIVAVLQKLEEEISERNSKRRKIRNIGCQQLKHLLLNDTIENQEIWEMIQQVEEQFLKKDYVVCCLEHWESEPEESESYLWIGEVEDHEVLITAQENKEFLLKNELRDSYVGISTGHCGTDELRIAYEEAKTARREAFLRIKHEVEYSGTKSQTCPASGEESMRQIAQMIGTDKIQDALRMTEQFFKEVRREGNSWNALEKNMAVLMEDIQHIYQTALHGEEEKILRFKNIYRFAHIEILQTELSQWMITLHDKVDTDFDDYKNRSKVQQALAYIQENFNKDINMAVVSNHVSMNYSPFSYAFKHYTGKNFVDYLKELRVQEAKRLLEETDLRVIEISQSVGYENDKHFMKVFKSQCGVSPTEYRKNMMLRDK